LYGDTLYNPHRPCHDQPQNSSSSQDAVVLSDHLDDTSNQEILLGAVYIHDIVLHPIIVVGRIAAAPITHGDSVGCGNAMV
jgi:hypothetical protein